MKENKYDNEVFFEVFFQKYSRMPRSQKGLDDAGEWNTLKTMQPDWNENCLTIVLIF